MLGGHLVQLIERIKIGFNYVLKTYINYYSEKISRDHPVQLIKRTQSGFELNIEFLKEFLHNDKIRDIPVVVISVAGDMRRGKSFMLNFFLRYLQSEDKENWLGDLDTPLTGFSWKNGKDHDTSGILIWSEPHVVRLANGDEYAILLMDTQGTFGKNSSMKTDVKIFALSTLLSSTQIFNINSQLREDNLDYLSLILNYGIFAMDNNESTEKPFQHLRFLIRDWNSPYIDPYGMEGGDRYLESFLNVDQTDNKQANKLRTFIKDCYTLLDCCLMPFPGKKVMSTEAFDGKLQDIDEDFLENLKLYVPKLFSEEYIMPKRINGSIVTGSGLLEYFIGFFKVLNSEENPDPQGVYNANLEASFTVLINNCHRFYKEEMEKICSIQSRFIEVEKFLEEHKRIKSLTLNKFDDKNKISKLNPEIGVRYKQTLEEEIEESFKIYSERNSHKNSHGTRFAFYAKLAAVWIATSGAVGVIIKAVMGVVTKESVGIATSGAVGIVRKVAVGVVTRAPMGFGLVALSIGLCLIKKLLFR